jgi:hypothetical protein
MLQKQICNLGAPYYKHVLCHSCYQIMVFLAVAGNQERVSWSVVCAPTYSQMMCGWGHRRLEQVLEGLKSTARGIWGPTVLGSVPGCES